MSRFRLIWQASVNATKKGLSSTSLEITDNKEGSKGIFSGNLSLDFTEDSEWNIKRGGFCRMRSKKFDGLIDLDGYDTVAMKLRGDRRRYISMIYTELGKFCGTIGRQLMAGFCFYSQG